MTTLYKTFKKGRIGTHSQKTWPTTLGKWVSVEGELELCKNGIHVARGELELLEWLADETYIVEARGDYINAYKKACYREVRLIKQVNSPGDRELRLFACWCAERALALVEKPDPRSVEAVRIARLYANGKATIQELDQARDAANAVFNGGTSITDIYVTRAAAITATCGLNHYVAQAVANASVSAAASVGNSVAARHAADSGARKSEEHAQRQKLKQLINLRKR